MRRIWLTGYRSYELGVFEDKDPKVTVIKMVLTERLTQLLNQTEDEVWVIAGPQMGVERWGLEVANELKVDYPQLKTSLIMPFAEFGRQWNESNQFKLQQMVAQVDYYGEVSNLPYQGPEQLRRYQQFLMEHSDYLLMVFDPEQELNPDQHAKPYWDYQGAQSYQATASDYEISLIMMDELQEAAENWAEQQREDAETYSE
ncbi:MAG: DUF1273 domain-containing protein [Limosilactobacillus sp.]|nr:DUF1273 domain-containing protein [Limosilactobacillus sp.]